MKLSLPPKLVGKLVWVPVISFCKIFIPSYAFDALLCRNWLFSPPNRLTLRITLITHKFFITYTNYFSTMTQSYARTSINLHKLDHWRWTRTKLSSMDDEHVRSYSRHGVVSLERDMRQYLSPISHKIRLGPNSRTILVHKFLKGLNTSFVRT